MKKSEISRHRVGMILLSISLSIVWGTAVYGHGVLSKEMETGKIKFSFDDGKPLAQGHITVYDTDEKEIATGRTDIEGVFDYSAYENVGKISVTDTHGHHRTHTIGKEPHDHSTAHDRKHAHEHVSGGNTTTVIAVLAILIVVAIVFYLGNRKKNEIGERTGD